MTIREYINQELRAFGVTEAQLFDICYDCGLTPEDWYDEQSRIIVWQSIARHIEKLLFAPKMQNVSESGFSMSWDYDNLVRYYLVLCKRSGIAPNDDALTLGGISKIKDKTDIW